MDWWNAPIWPSARRHGLTDEAIRHVVRHVLVQRDDLIDPDVVLVLGLDMAGNFIEVGVLINEEPPVIIHAMRKSLQRFLREHEG